MQSMRAFLVVTVAVAAVLGSAHGASYTVGSPAGSWDLRTNLTRWASGATFRSGDQLVFKYSPSAHDVVEVTKAGYDSCSAAGAALATFSTGDDVVRLSAAGVTRYFICSVPGHCDAGMKLAVRVQAPAAAPAGAPSPNNAAAPSPMTVAARARQLRSRRWRRRTPPARGPSPWSSAAAPGAAPSVAALVGLAAAVAALMAF